MTKKIELTEELKEQVFGFLDAFRLTGHINMFGSGPLVQEAFDVDRHQAKELVLEWMETFATRHYSGA
jgi:Leu/Phe-tRNA-protein transferase